MRKGHASRATLAVLGIACLTLAGGALASATRNGGPDACTLCRLPAIHAAASPLPQQASDEIARLTAECEQRNFASCNALGVIYRDSSGVSKDLVRAAALFKQACDGGDSGGCLNFGLAYTWGVGVSKDGARAIALIKQTCDGGHAEACAWLGYFYLGDYSERIVPMDRSYAAQLFRQACEGGSPRGCYYLGRFHWHGGQDEPPKDEQRALALYKQACAGNFADACRALPQMEKDVAAYQSWRERLTPECERNNYQSCFDLGRMVAWGQGGPLDAKTGAALQQKSCDGGHGLACYQLGEHYEFGSGVPKDMDKAETFYRKACTGGGGGYTGCVALSNLAVRYETGQSVPRDQSKAVALYQQACNGGESKSCDRLISLGALPHGRYPLTVVEAARACKQGGTGRSGFYAQTSCEYLRAFLSIQSLCFSGRVQSCIGIAESAAKAKDFKVAAIYYKWACGSDKGSCKKAEDAAKKANQGR
jgi:TPR repeat protein